MKFPFSFRFDHDLKNPIDPIIVQCEKVALLNYILLGTPEAWAENEK